MQEKQRNKPQTNQVEITAQTYAINTAFCAFHLRCHVFSLPVFSKISHTRIFLFEAIKPSFEGSGFGPFYLFKRTEGQLKCNPKAAPRPTKDQYKWYKGTTLLTSSPPYRIEHEEFSTLIIDNVDQNRDEGLYKCYAENFLGNATENATATVLGENTMHICLLNKRALDMAESPCPVLDCIADVLQPRSFSFICRAGQSNTSISLKF